MANLPRLNRAKILQAIPGASPELVRALESVLVSVSESIPGRIEQAIADAASASGSAAAAQAAADSALALATTAVQGANGPDGRVQVAAGGGFSSFSALTYSDATQRISVGGLTLGKGTGLQGLVEYMPGPLRLSSSGAYVSIAGAEGVKVWLASPGGTTCPFTVETMFGKVIEAGDDLSDQKVLGFYGVTAVNRPNVTGSRGGNAALQSLLDALEALGLLTDSSTA